MNIAEAHAWPAKDLFVDFGMPSLGPTYRTGIISIEAFVKRGRNTGGITLGRSYSAGAITHIGKNGPTDF